MRQSIAVFLSWMLLAGLGASAQQVGQNSAGAAAPATFTTTSQLVIETVSVKDKQGNPVLGLKQENFTVTEDGKPQVIKFFEFQQLDDTPAAPLLETRTPAEPAKAADKAPEKPKVESLTAGQIVGEAPGVTRYKDKRLLAMYFDMTAMPVPDQLRALSAAEKFIKTQMSGPDLMCIMEYAGEGVKILTDFTDDREALMATLDKLIIGEGQGFDQSDTSAAAADTGAAFGQDDSEFNIFYTDRQLGALQTAVKMLGTLNEKKSLIYFASGLNLNGTDNQAQLHATTNAAARAAVSFYPIDARGLQASSPFGDATRGSQGGVSMYTGAAAMAVTTGLQRSQDTLYALASDTGGKAFLDYNDLSLGIVQAQKAIESYYLIGYYSTNTALDGKFRKIVIKLDNGIEPDYRHGYYAGKVYGKFTTADKDRQLEDALMMGDPITDITIRMEIDHFQLNGAEYFVPIMVKIPGSELTLARKGGAEITRLDFIWEVKDNFGSTYTNNRDHMDIKLSDTTAAELTKKPIQYASGFTLLPGSYKIKFLARDFETGRMGTFENSFVIPNLNKEEKRVPISSVVLSSQRDDVKDRLFNAQKDKGAADLVNPLILDGQQLIPSVTRVFSKTKDMYIYLQAYERGQTTQQPLVAFVTFYRGQTKAFETPPLSVTEGMNLKSKAVPMRFSVPLGKLPTGEYNCQVTVLDPNGNKAAFWQAPVTLIP